MSIEFSGASSRAICRAPTKYELAINLQIAETLGLENPDWRRATAGEAIE
jgi:hypothetical protein